MNQVGAGSAARAAAGLRVSLLCLLPAVGAPITALCCATLAAGALRVHDLCARQLRLGAHPAAGKRHGRGLAAAAAAAAAVLLPLRLLLLLAAAGFAGAGAAWALAPPLQRVIHGTQNLIRPAHALPALPCRKRWRLCGASPSSQTCTPSRRWPCSGAPPPCCSPRRSLAFWPTARRGRQGRLPRRRALRPSRRPARRLRPAAEARPQFALYPHLSPPTQPCAAVVPSQPSPPTRGLSP